MNSPIPEGEAASETGLFHRRSVLVGGAAGVVGLATVACSGRSSAGEPDGQGEPGEERAVADQAIPPPTLILRPGSDQAVVFLSRSGNTRVLATAIARRTGADLIEIRPREPWPEDYDAMVAWASRWRESDRPLPLAQTYDLVPYQRIYLAFPIWGMAVPAPVRSLMQGSDLAGKTIIPVITHGNYGPGNAVDALRGYAPQARLDPPFILPCDQERTTLERLDGWFSGAG